MCDSCPAGLLWTRGAEASGCKLLPCSLTLCPSTVSDKQEAPARCGLDPYFLASRSKELRFWYLQQLCVPGTDPHHTQASMVMRVKDLFLLCLQCRDCCSVLTSQSAQGVRAGYRLARGGLVGGSLQVPGQHCALF